jgi:hypothetical protein
VGDGIRQGFSADIQGFTPNTQMIRGGSEAVDHSFDFKTWFAEIEQQAEA